MSNQRRPTSSRLTLLTTLAIAAACEPNPYDASLDSDSGGGEPEIREPLAPLSDLAAPAPEPAFAGVGANPYHRVESGTCWAGDPDCVETIPMTGRVSPLFSRLDDAMRQYMKIHCVGAAVLSVSRNGRRIYKRGFGRTKGIAAAQGTVCPQADWDATASYMLPDTPLPIGSVTKFVTAAMVRELVAQRLDQVGWGSYTDVSEVLLLDESVGLLPDHIVRHLDPSHSSLAFVTPPVGCCALDASCVDPRWDDITIGDLLSHSSGLPNLFANLEDITRDVGAIRGYQTRADWQEAHDNLQATTKYPTQMLIARQDLVSQTNASAASDIYFLDHYNAADGYNVIDDHLIASAGTCLASNPLGATDSNPTSQGPGVVYSNFGYAILGRVAAHLHAELGLGDDLYAEPMGFTERHDDSALGTFLANNGLEEGIWAEHPIFRRQTGYEPGYQDPIPQRREWNAGQATYVAQSAPSGRPFCVWSSASNDCDTDVWPDDTSGANANRPTWAFDVEDPFNPGSSPTVPFYLGLSPIWSSSGQGGLAMEAPAMLRLLERYFVDDNGNANNWNPVGTWTGRDFAACGASCQRPGGKYGSYAGTRAWGYQIEGGTRTDRVPVDALGRFITSTIDTSWPQLTWTEPTGVRFAVATNTGAREPLGPDATPGSSGKVGPIVAYALSTPATGPNVDWNAVDRMIEHQSRHIVGMAMASNATFYWYEDDTMSWGFGDPGDHVAGGAPGGVFPYEMPSTRIGTDVIDVAIHSGTTYAWYEDGHYSSGLETDFTGSSAQLFTLPPGQHYEDLVGIGMSTKGAVVSWYRDGTRASGTLSDFDAYWVAGYSVPPGQTYDDIEAITIDWQGNNHIWTRFKDGSVAEGRSGDLDFDDYHRGPVAGMSMFAGKTRVWYGNGYRRLFAGTPADNMSFPVVLDRSYWDVSNGYDFGDVVGIVESAEGVGAVYYSDAHRAEILDGLVSELASVFPVTVPAGQSAANLIGVAIGHPSVVLGWFSNWTVGWGPFPSMTSSGSYSLPLGADPSSVAGIAYDYNGTWSIWTLFDHGGVAEGHATDLAAYGTWNAP